MVSYLRAGEVLDDEHHPLALQEFLSYVSYFLRHIFLEIRCFSVRRIFANSSVRFLRSDLLCSFALPTCCLSAPRFIAEPLPHDFIPDFLLKVRSIACDRTDSYAPALVPVRVRRVIVDVPRERAANRTVVRVAASGRDDSRFPLYAVARNF